MYKGRILTSCIELTSRFKGKGQWVRSWVDELALPAIACLILLCSCSEGGNLVRETTIDTIRLDYQIPNLTLQMRVDDPQLVGRRIVKAESSCSCLGVKILDGHNNANRGVLCEVRIDVPMTSVLKTVSFDLLLDDSSVVKVKRALYLMYDIDFTPASGVLVITNDGNMSGYIGLEVKSNRVDAAEIEYTLVMEDSLQHFGRLSTPKDRKTYLRIPVNVSRSCKGCRVGRVDVSWSGKKRKTFNLYEPP